MPRRPTPLGQVSDSESEDLLKYENEKDIRMTDQSTVSKNSVAGHSNSGVESLICDVDPESVLMNDFDTTDQSLADDRYQAMADRIESIRIAPWIERYRHRSEPIMNITPRTVQNAVKALSEPPQFKLLREVSKFMPGGGIVSSI